MKITQSKLTNFLHNPESYGSALIYGNDYPKVSLYIQRVLSSVTESGAFVVHKMEFAKVIAEPEQLLTPLMTIPMFHQKSLVLLTDAKDALFPDLKYALENMNTQYYYVLIQARELSGNSSLKSYYNGHAKFASVACYREDKIAHIVFSFLSENKVTYDSTTFEFLCTLLQSNGNTCIQAELEKLLLYMGTEKKLSMEDIQKALDTGFDPVLDDLCVAIAEGNLLSFLNISDALFQNKIAPVLIIRSSIKYFMRLELLSRKVRSGEDAEQVIKEMQPPVFFKLIYKLKKHASALPYSSIQTILRYLFEAEIQCKSSDTNQEVIFKYLMCSLISLIKRTAQRRNSAPLTRNLGL